VPVSCKRSKGVLPMFASIEPGAIVSIGSSKSIVGALISNPKSKTGRDFEKCDRLRRKIAGQWLAIASSACTRPLGRAAIAAALTPETTHAGLEHDGETIGSRQATVKPTNCLTKNPLEMAFVASFKNPLEIRCGFPPVFARTGGEDEANDEGEAGS